MNLSAEQRKMLELAITDLESVLCDPEGKPVCRGSEGDRTVIAFALGSLRALLAPPRVITDARELLDESDVYLVRTIGCKDEGSLMWLCGTDGNEYLYDEDETLCVGKIDDFTGRYEALPVTLPEWPK